MHRKTNPRLYRYIRKGKTLALRNVLKGKR